MSATGRFMFTFVLFVAAYSLGAHASLPRAVAALAGSLRAAGLEISLSVDGDHTTLPPAVDVSAYRIVQEALTNVLKHAGPARAEVTVCCTDVAVTIEVTDDGPGNPAPPAVKGAGEAGGGHGLAGMREREREVARLVAAGLSNAEIAARLYLSEATIKNHITRILARLGLRDRVQIAVFAYEHGIVRPGHAS